MPTYRNLDGVAELQSVVVVPFGGDAGAVVDGLKSRFELACRVCRAEEFQGTGTEAPPDLLLLGPDDDHRQQRATEFCRGLRSRAYQGTILLVLPTRDAPLSTSDITGLGFDNYLVLEDGAAAWQDSIHWGIINRRRKNKYVIQFDGSPDCFCMLDRRGLVCELNATAAGGSGHTPREIVTRRIPADRLPALRSCVTIVLPLIAEQNVGLVSEHTINEGKSVFQLKVKIHDVPTIGLVATVLKSDISETITNRTLDILVNSLHMLSERDQYTAGHSARVLLYCAQLLEVIGHGGQLLRSQVYHAALLHDIGKVGVRDSILLKPGRLTHAEFGALATHPVKGFRILSHFEFLADSLELVRHHHERPDGRGYPDKLKGARIPFGASIIAVADGFDAMTTNRPYRVSLGYERAVQEIAENAGSQYDREIARAFLGSMTPALYEDIKRRAHRPLEVVAREVFGTI